MLQLINISSYTSDIDLINNDPIVLKKFLEEHQIDGLELMFYDEWDERLYPREMLKGVHLRFWPAWLDFWRGNKRVLLEEFGSEENIVACYGGLTREAWLKAYRANIRTAVKTGAHYLVFHVSHARIQELFSWQFSASDSEVIEATIELVNELVDEIPPNVALLFENLWWPGLTLKNPALVSRLLDHVKHSNVGIMLDVGHLMNTNPELKTEGEGVDYILSVLHSLGDYRRYVRGVHLHKSLSGEYRRESLCKQVEKYDMGEIMNHVLNIDQHQPFSTSEVQRLIHEIKPEFLVHEFMYSSIEEWSEKIKMQKAALQVNR
ncbi:sugar phosphate isomerase/epimerase family protein [Pelosinus sp. sgz500959]|uniref:sugar phosphate isomerase/epimerase family protein n=1 Tax=Pelosinus sp. sgz500959 TaxID=3242472 RepID=UPI00367344C2